MEKTPCLFIATASAEDIRDATSWINTSYQWDQEWQDTICQRLGEAISAWALIENHLFRIYHRAIKASEGRAASWVWDSIHSAGALIDMTDAALRGMEETMLDVDGWNSIYKNLTRKVVKRNRIAHCQIFYDHRAKNAGKKMFVSSPHQAQGIDKRFYTSELVDLRKGFQELADTLEEFCNSTFT